MLVFGASNSLCTLLTSVCIHMRLFVFFQINIMCPCTMRICWATTGYVKSPLDQGTCSAPKFIGISSAYWHTTISMCAAKDHSLCYWICTDYTRRLLPFLLPSERSFCLQWYLNFSFCELLPCLFRRILDTEVDFTIIVSSIAFTRGITDTINGGVE